MSSLWRKENKTKSCWRHEALSCRTLESITAILLSAARMRKDGVWSFRSTSRQSCEGSDATCLLLQKVHQPYCLWTPLTLPTRRMPKVLLIIQRLSPMTATRDGLQTSCLDDWGVNHWWCLLYYESTLCHMYGSYREMKYKKKLSDGTVWRARVTWSKGFGMRLVFHVHRPNKCTEPQCVFSSEVQQGPINYWGMSEVGRGTKSKEEGWQWNGVPWWAESQWCIRRDTACV